MTLLARSSARRLAVGATAASLAALGLVPASAGTAPVEQGTHSPNLTAVANLPYAAVAGSDGEAPNRGTDIEFATIRGTSYALAGSYQNGLQIVDITKPEQPRIAAVYDCGVQQGDVQVFTRGTRTYVGYTQDDGYELNASSSCVQQAEALGFPVVENSGYGTFVADITDVGTGKKDAIRTVSWVQFDKGSHNHTVHPSGDYIYNSNSDLITSLASGGPSIEIYDIRDFAAPKRLDDLALPPVPTSLGAESHDITFNDEGTRAYSAALSQTAIIDTTNPAAPKLVSTIVDPTINVVHQADPVTLTDPLLGTRDFLIIEDEFAGALGTGQCPNGGVHVYDVTGGLERTPVKVGYWNIDEVRATSNDVLGTCTAHVFDLHEQAKTMTIAYYNGGVRVVDLSGLVGVALGANPLGVGMKEVGFHRFANSDTWSAKTPKVEADGSFYLYGNDQARGLDVYKFSKTAPASTSKGRWMGASEAATVLGARPKLDLGDYQLLCMV